MDERQQHIDSLKSEILILSEKLGPWKVIVCDYEPKTVGAYGYRLNGNVYELYVVDMMGNFHSVSKTSDEVLILQRLLREVRAQSNLQKMERGVRKVASTYIG